jgi:hypothetical protein
MPTLSHTLLAAAAALALLAAPTAGFAQDPHAGHTHGHAHGAETLKADLGTTTLAGLEITVTQGNLAEPGKEVAFDITARGAAPPQSHPRLDRQRRRQGRPQDQSRQRKRRHLPPPR